ncbi:MAG: DUF2911 domain-containing protein [Gemmatimonadaceae bacterium]
MRSLLAFAALAVTLSCATSPRAAGDDQPSPQIVTDTAPPDTTQRDTTRPPPGTASDSQQANGGVASETRASGGNGSAATAASAPDRAGAPVAPSTPRPAPLSPRDSVRLEVGAAELSVNYSRPSMRGRKIFGELVPFGRLWRTGANEATTFVTTADIEIGGVTVPAGRYSLFTVPAEPGSQWLLVINKQTGQSGTEHHPEQDLARVPLRTRTLTPPVEQFTIALEPAGPDAAALSLAWETTSASMNVRVKRP